MLWEQTLSFPKHKDRHKYGRTRRDLLHAQLPPNSSIIMFVYGKFALLTLALAALEIKERYHKGYK